MGFWFFQLNHISGLFDVSESTINVTDSSYSREWFFGIMNNDMSYYLEIIVGGPYFETYVKLDSGIIYSRFQVATGVTEMKNLKYSNDQIDGNPPVHLIDRVDLYSSGLIFIHKGFISYDVNVPNQDTLYTAPYEAFFSYNHESLYPPYPGN